MRLAYRKHGLSVERLLLFMLQTGNRDYVIEESGLEHGAEVEEERRLRKPRTRNCARGS